jgi:hypothetical protein
MDNYVHAWNTVDAIAVCRREGEAIRITVNAAEVTCPDCRSYLRSGMQPINQLEAVLEHVDPDDCTVTEVYVSQLKLNTKHTWTDVGVFESLPDGWREHLAAAREFGRGARFIRRVTVEEVLTE